MAQKGWTPEDADALRQAVGDFVRVGRSHDLVPRPQSIVLGYLDREGGLSIAELAERAGVRHQTMRVTVAALAEAGAVDIARSATDGRKVLCSLSEEGRAMLDRDREARSVWILEGVRRLSSEQQALARQIPAILRALSAEPTQDAAGA